MVTKLWRDYKRWAGRTGKRASSKKAWGEYLSVKGKKKKKKRR